MHKKLFILTFLLVIAGFLTGHTQVRPYGLYVPVEFQNAYKKGTRNPDGTVAQKFWQNHSKYKIKAVIDPKTKVLKGEATIIYFNNSPDSLKYPGFYAYHNLYKQGTSKPPNSIAADSLANGRNGL